MQPPPPLKITVWQVAQRALGQAIERAAQLVGLSPQKDDTSDNVTVKGAGVQSEPTHAGDEGDLASVLPAGLDPVADKKNKYTHSKREPRSLRIL